MYTFNEEGYSVFFQYNCERGEIQENIENIDILYINDNHFNLLIPNKVNGERKNDIIRNNINITNLKSIILEDKSKSNRKLMKDLKIHFKQKNYVDYPRNNLTNYYNEIYTYLLDNKIPQRLEYSGEKSRKTMEKKELGLKN